ncbi:U6 snRNA-associated Sm-like protein [Dimargaris verticillata]|uniref:LSM2-LSM8 complex subunit LSM8 n=1 Tax=Dimargaris verticillata TaxID=2761393 RepID=A0A9W8EF01_9FUNG|nr:U6 snRNA-associated Sm-like protein [Dimargaris verticillata]
MSEIQAYVNERVLVVTSDGRVIVGTLKGFDQVTNIVLADCQERIFSPDDGVEMAPLGLYFIRGDNIAVVGLVDQEQDSSLQFGALRAQPLPEILHGA